MLVVRNGICKCQDFDIQLLALREIRHKDIKDQCNYEPQGPFLVALCTLNQLSTKCVDQLSLEYRKTSPLFL